MATCTRSMFPRILLASVLTAMFVPGLSRLQIDSDPISHLPKNDDNVAAWRAMNIEFDALNLMMIGLEEPISPFTSDGLSRLQRISAALAERKADGLVWVRSLANLEDVREDGEGTLNATLALPAIPQTEAERQALSQKILANPNAMGSMVSRDLRAYVILVRIDPAKSGAIAVIREIVEAGRGPLTVHYFGLPFVTASVSDRLSAALPWLLPVSLCLLLGGLWWGVRRPGKVFCVLGGGLLVMMWWVGGLGLAQIPLTAQVMGVPLLLLPIALACFASWPVRPMARTLALSAAGLALAGLGVLTDLPLQDVALAGALGLVCILLLDALIAIPVGEIGVGEGMKKDSPRSTLRFTAVALTLCLSAAGWLGFRFLVMPGEMFFSSEETGSTIAFMDRRFGGSDYVQVRVEGDLKRNVEAARLMRFTDLLEGISDFSDVRSVTQVLGMLAGNFGGTYHIPESRAALDNLWFFVEGSPDLRSLASNDRTVSMVALRLPSTPLDAARAGKLEQAVREAFERSGHDDQETAERRIMAMAARAGVQIPADALARAMAEASAIKQEGGLPEAVLNVLYDSMKSPDAPFQPTKEEWEKTAAEIRATGSRETLARFVQEWKSFRDSGASPAVAHQLAETFLTRASDQWRETRSRFAMKTLLGSAVVDPVVANRMRGVLADLDTRREGDSTQQITISGYPLIAARLSDKVNGGVAMGIVAIAAMAGLMLLLSGRGALSRARRIALLVLLAGGATLGVLYLTGLHADPGSLALCFLSPLIVAVLFEVPQGDAKRAIDGVLAGFVLVSAVLIVSGVGPIVRMAMVLIIGTAMAWFLVRKGGRS